MYFLLTVVLKQDDSDSNYLDDVIQRQNVNHSQRYFEGQMNLRRHPSLATQMFFV